MGIVLYSCQASAIHNQFKGTWQLISGEYIDHQGTLIDYNDLNLKSIKVLSDSHFSFVTLSGSKFWSSGSGSYRFQQQSYIETPIYTSYQHDDNAEYTFSYKIDDGYWYNERWQQGIRVEYEVWQKVAN